MEKDPCRGAVYLFYVIISPVFLYFFGTFCHAAISTSCYILNVFYCINGSGAQGACTLTTYNKAAESIHNGYVLVPWLPKYITGHGNWKQILAFEGWFIQIFPIWNLCIQRITFSKEGIKHHNKWKSNL